MRTFVIQKCFSALAGYWPTSAAAECRYVSIPVIRLFAASALASFGMLAACTATNPTRMVEIIENKSSTELWLEYGRSQSPIALSLIETELVARGEKTFLDYYIGQKTANNVGISRYVRASTTINADLKNCSDFATAGAAQRYFIQSGGPMKDPHNLDADGDGLACEWGTQIRRIATDAKKRRRQTYAPQRTYSPHCYVGPRGGTYTITASGNKNYSGC
ncbi:MAG: excalibur calcium-binding domain-containing protein [Rhodobacteraceae bacterium]|nr:excalibur calcium-binding domain-containing protein [Paracoccaceae bacterium]